MKVGKPSEDRVIVRVIQSKRDSKTEKIKYETFESFDVYEATPEQVYKVAFEAVRKA
jgi:hypothetical protein